MQDMAVGIWFAYFGQVSWGYTTPWSRPCRIKLQGDAATIGAPAILLEVSCPQATSNSTVPVAWITEPAIDSP